MVAVVVRSSKDYARCFRSLCGYVFLIEYAVRAVALHYSALSARPKEPAPPLSYYFLLISPNTSGAQCRCHVVTLGSLPVHRAVQSGTGGVNSNVVFYALYAPLFCVPYFGHSLKVVCWRFILSCTFLVCSYSCKGVSVRMLVTR
jgi:hypothetical protein